MTKLTKRVCVWSIDNPSTWNLGHILRDSLLEIGIDAWIASSEQGSNREADIILSVSGGRMLNGFLETIKDFKGKKPVSILWMIDPVPPPELTEHAEYLGILLSRLDWQKKYGKRRGQIIKKVLPLGREFCRLSRWILARRINKEMSHSNNCCYTSCDNAEWFRVMDRYVTTKNLLSRGLIDYCFVSTIAKQKFFESRGLTTNFVPFGYHPAWGGNLELNRDIDVLFLGRFNNKRRNKVVKTIEEQLKARGIGLKIVDKDCFGRERTELLNRTKIVLDVPRVPWDIAGTRFLMSMSCGAMVISEKVDYIEPYKDGVHFVQAESEKIAEKIFYYLEHEDERKEIVNSAYKFVVEELTLKKMIIQILEFCDANPAIQNGSM